MAARWMQGLGRSALAVAWLLALAVPGLSPGDATAAEARGLRHRSVAAAGEDPDNARVIVKYRNGSALARDAAGAPRHAARLGRQMTLALEDGHVLGRRTQSLRARGLTSTALAARLAANPEVEWAVPVRRKTITAVIPNDPYFADGQTSITPAAGQWYLRAPDATLVSAINAVGAWGITEGAATITVAVLDTGVRFDHPDFVKSGGSSKLWPGYDFVSRSTASNDGGGRDADASDPGDWSVSTDSCGAEPSSWHGTQVAGLIGAASDNGIGMASVGRNVMVLPVRVLGKCGGFDDDIIAGMRWAAGLSSDPVPNPHPARVINLSLGSSGACSTSYRDAVAELTAAGVAVVVAAGNDAGRAVNEPANCPGAIAVSGVRHAGSKVGYSNLGPEVALAAPAGNCVTLTAGACVYPLLTTVNAGSTAPGINTYSDSRDATLGTSFASPLVAGTVALMLSVDPRLTPAQIKTTLQATVRPFPSTGAQEPGTVACTAPGSVDQIECYCTTSTCGAGLLDAGAAVTEVQLGTLLPTAVISTSTTTPTVGTSVTLDGALSTASSGRSITGYQWALTSGAVRASFTGATNGSSATLATSAVGAVVVQLTVTDSFGATHSSTQTITVAAVPVVVTPAAAGGGGGAMGGGWLLGLALAIAGLARWPARRVD
ncbi:MAG: S8 family peptidase [Aquabacterium sp.]|nr:S8 family peptidase [Aquabacterium sp.]